MPVGIPATPLAVQLQETFGVLGKDPRRVPGSWLQLVHAVAVVTSWGVNQQVQDLSLMPSLMLRPKEAITHVPTWGQHWWYRTRLLYSARLGTGIPATGK